MSEEEMSEEELEVFKKKRKSIRLALDSNRKTNSIGFIKGQKNEEKNEEQKDKKKCLNV